MFQVEVDSLKLLPIRGTRNSAGLDLKIKESITVLKNTVVLLDTGVKVAIPDGYFGLLVPRSSMYKKGLYLANTVGIIDSDYRGELKIAVAVADNWPSSSVEITAGDRLVQLILLPYLVEDPTLVASLSSTERGSGGFGSTGT